MPTETNLHRDALCLMVQTRARHKTTEASLNNGWRLVSERCGTGGSGGEAGPSGRRLRLGWRPALCVPFIPPTNAPSWCRMGANSVSLGRFRFRRGLLYPPTPPPSGDHSRSQAKKTGVPYSGKAMLAHDP